MLTIDRLTLQLPYYAAGYAAWWKRRWATCLDAFSLTFCPGEVHAVVVPPAPEKVCWPMRSWGYCPHLRA
ncbi:hypothetical protein HORIV_19370 [Vreelandella olivaria]|uniref:Uncharacterized protein n=1 Tax=Vreelandella olivaria TaxID=390919 RepID=A0ABN5WY83_9GAMM|nr:hypothetical protein HORIV_19370 [Halomonas olivaria]